MDISKKIIFATVASLILLGGVLTTLAYIDMHEEEDMLVEDMARIAYNGKKEELKNIILLVHGSVKSIYEQKSKEGASKAEILDAVKTIYKDVRFFDDKSGYIFLFKDNGKIIFHAGNSSLEGKNLNNTKDKNDVFFMQELAKLAKTGGGIVEYHWPKKKDAPAEKKFSYALEFKPLNWLIATGVYVDSVEKELAHEREKVNVEITHQVEKFVMISFVLIALCILIMMFIVKRNVSNPLKNLIDRTRELSSGDGDLTRKLEIIGDDEIAHASSCINDFIEKVKILIVNAKGLSNENSSIAHELSTTSLEVGKLVEQSTAIVNDTSSHATSIQQEMKEGISEAKTSKDDLEDANGLLKEANKAIANLTQEIKTSASTEVELAHKIQQLSSDTEQVKDVLLVIGDIADQTNLLALNAAIEAARAGEHGRGFAVVADEVRKLAERTQKSLTEINSTISVIVQSIMDSSEQMTANSKKVEQLSNTAISVEERITELSSVMGGATMMADKTVTNYIQTCDDIDVIIKSVGKINSISTENARSVEEIASAAEHMNKMTETLNNKLSEFRT